MFKQASLAIAASAVLFNKPVTAQTLSSLYPTVDPVLLANAFNISIGCLDALNQTVSCDASLLQMAGSVDNYLWFKDNITALCTADCQSSASSWWTSVIGACSHDYMNNRGRLVPAHSVPGRIISGLNIACLTPNTNLADLPGVNGIEVTETITSVTNSTVTYDPGPAPTSLSRSNKVRELIPPPARNRPGLLQMQNNVTGLISPILAVTTGYCLLESYNWVGQDIIRPDCPDGSTDPQCLDPTDVPDANQRVANLYPDSILCSQCFLNMFFLRMSSPYLPDTDFADNLLVQYLDIIDVCQVQMPDLFVRILPAYAFVNGTFDGQPAVSSTSPSGTVTCNQTLAMSDLKTLSIPDPTANGTIWCDALSTKYGVTTGDLQLAFGSYYCEPSADFTSVCLPSACNVLAIPYNTSCDAVITLLAKYPKTASQNITTTQLLSWNPNLQGLCDSLNQQYICIGAPGGTYIPPPVSNQTSSDADQTRSGGTGDSTGDGSVIGGGRNATVVQPGSAAPSPTQSGITPKCTEYAMASPGDGCYTLTQLWRIPESDFYTWNTVLGPNGENCSAQLFANYYYCIDIVRSASATPISSGAGPTSTGVTAPGPTQSGIVTNCNKYAEAQSGDGCQVFASRNGITPAQLYAWNTVLGLDGETCGTSLWAQEYYCVGVGSTSTAPTTTSTSVTVVTAPGPTQSGIVLNCNKYAETQSGDGCQVFASRNGITPAQLYTWNSVLGPNGENCNTELWANEWYCVSV